MLPYSAEAYHGMGEEAAEPVAFQMNDAVVDEWTKVHVLSGVFTGLLGVRPSYAAAGAVAYEVLEYAHEWPSGSVLFGSKRPESIGNVVSDLVVFACGYAAAAWVRSRLGGK